MTHFWGNRRVRSGLGAVGIATAAIVLAGCSGTPSTQAQVVGKAAATEVPTIPACAPDQVADTKKYAADYAKNLIASQDLRAGYNGATKVIDIPESVDAATKTAMLPCIPAIDVAKPAANPPNVATIQQVISLDQWSKLILPNKVGTGNQKDAPQVTGFEDPANSYKSFLTTAARMPYFCGDKGQWETELQACQRELSTFFAHAIQETGEKPVPAGEQLWQTALFQTREGACYPNVCDQYNGGAANFDAPKDVSYYGRGIKQLSWVYNYAAFSASYYGDMDILVNQPDLVATDVDLVLGSGIWFAMQPQTKKPSMHDVVTGNFKPHDMPASGEFKGVNTQADGSIFQKFSATVSIINGAYECSPTSSGEALQTQLQQSKNRFINYKALLPLFGVPEADQTKNEKEIVPGETYCTIANGSPWGEADAAGKFPLGWEIPFLLNVGTPGSKDGTCFAVTYGQPVTLSISTPGSLDVCQTHFSPGGSPTPTAPPVTPTAPVPSPTETAGTEEETSATSANGNLKVTITKSASWTGGYCATIAATSVKGSTIDNWNVTFGLTGDQTATGGGWDSTLTKAGDWYVFEPTEWTRKVGPNETKGGGGFCVDSASNTQALPVGLQVNDKA